MKNVTYINAGAGSGKTYTLIDRLTKLIAKKEVEPEQEYLDYILNKSTFSDGLDLRNKYAHGTIFRDDRLNSRDYLEFLIIIV